MIDHQDRTNQGQDGTTPTADESAADALFRDDIQKAQDKAGIAGEPQPAGADPEAAEPE